MEDLRDSREGYDQLTSWLAQKDKMVAILGPISGEPAMVNNQLQQVQVSLHFSFNPCITQSPAFLVVVVVVFFFFFGGLLSAYTKFFRG